MRVTRGCTYQEQEDGLTSKCKTSVHVQPQQFCREVKNMENPMWMTSGGHVVIYEILEGKHEA